MLSSGGCIELFIGLKADLINHSLIETLHFPVPSLARLIPGVKHMATAKTGEAKVEPQGGMEGHQVGQPAGAEVGGDQVKEAMANGDLQVRVEGHADPQVVHRAGEALLEVMASGKPPGFKDLKI
jgi:hypothetical protein